MKAYGSIMNNQQWIQTVSYWSRSMFAIFTAAVILYFVITFRFKLFCRYQIDVSFTECNIYHPMLFDLNVN